MSRRIRAILVALAMLWAATAASVADASTGGEDVYGYSWVDSVDGCPFSVPSFGSGVRTFYTQTGVLGPIPLGFSMRFYEGTVNQIWISATGYVTFSDQGGAATSTQDMPSVAGPNNLIAAHWAPTIVESTVRYESTPTYFHIQWLQRLDPALTSRWLTDLILNVDGTFQMRWLPPARFDGVTVGYEDAPGGRGRTIWRNGVGEAGFGGPPVIRTLCILRPARLDCTLASRANCGDSLALATNAVSLPAASIYNCAGSLYLGNERIVQLDVAATSVLTVGIDSPDLDIFEILNPPCRENTCVAFGDTSITYPLVFPGTYWFVVDGLASGGGVPFTFTSNCTSAYQPLACGQIVSDTTAGRASVLADHGCNWRRLNGGERFYQLNLASATSVFAILDGRTPDLWVAIYTKADFEAGNGCLYAARGAAALQLAPAGEYVVVVDGESAAGGPFSLEVQCGLTPDCGSTSPVGCLSVVSGDTTGGANGLVAYSCLREALLGPERFYRITNPTLQTLTARFRSSQPGQRIVLVRDCPLGQCLLGDAAGFSCPLLPPGDYFLVVDGLDGSEGPYQFEIACSDIEVGVDLRAVDVDLRGTGSSCLSPTVSGAVDVTVANMGTQVAPGPIEVVVFEDLPPLDGVYSGTDILLGTEVHVADMAPGATAVVPVPVAGDLAFRDAPLSAAVDPGGLIVEANDANNGFDSSLLCEFHPPIGLFSPVVEWRWRTTTVMDTYVQVDTTPMVADVDADAVPDVIIVTGEVPAGFADGVVRVLDGADGSEIWTAVDPAAMVYSSSNPAVADLDADGAVEIIAHSWAVTGTPRGHQLVCLDSDGSLRWISQDFIDHPVVFEGGGGASIADIDCDGDPEIIYGKNVFNADGTYFWRPETGGTIGVNEDGRNLDGSLSVVVDVDGDGILEVVAGPTCYKLNPSRIDPGYGVPVGEILWRNALVPDGFPAVGQFDADDAPEIVLAAYGSVFLLEGDTGQARWQTDLPIGGGGCAPTIVMGGPPTVADFDGDYAPEIGVAGADWYVVIETNGEIKWQAPIVDCSSHRTASSVFDFDGDGAAEVAFMDETKLHVYRGRDGFQLTSINTSSHTWQEMITIADVDADGSAEVIVPLNSELASGPRGIMVVGDVDDNWVNTRRIWNQHAYHIDHVNEDGTIPGPSEGCEIPSWQRHGTYRDQLGSVVYTAPDLTVMVWSVDILIRGDCDHLAHIVFRIGNAGGIPGGAGGQLAFYDGDPATGGGLQAIQPLLELGPGEWYEVTMDAPLPRVGFVDFYIAVDDNGRQVGVIDECREDNNGCAFAVDNPPFPDPPPVAVGPALRATAHGDPYNAWCTGTFNWLLDAGIPRPPDDHYHILRSTDPRSLPLLTTFHPYAGTTYVDRTSQTPLDQLPLCHYFVIVAADECEQIEAP